MSNPVEIEAHPRDRAGKGAARAARRSSLIPAVIYGAKKDPVLCNLDLIPFNRLYRDPAFMTHLYKVKVSGKTETAIVKDVQLHPVTDAVIHVDFLRTSATSRVTVNVPVSFINEDACPALKEGAVLEVVRHEIEVTAPAGDVPDQIEVDLSGFGTADSIHISHVTLPQGIEPTITDRDFTIATITAPSGMKADAE